MSDTTTLQVVGLPGETPINPVTATVTVIGTVPNGPPGASGSSRLDELEDVDVDEDTITDGQALVWDDDAERWVAGDPTGGGGAVDSVNGQTGVVTLDAGDVGADPAGSAASAVTAHESDTTNVHGIANTALLETTTGAAAKVAAHEADTTNVHGITNTANLETTSGAQAKVDAHVNDAEAAHAASAISTVDAGNWFAAEDVEGALDELAAAVDTVSSDAATTSGIVAAHVLDTSDAHDASAISFSPASGIAATDAQAAIVEAKTDAQTYADAAVTTHEADTTSVHGIANTANLETTSGAQAKADAAQSAAQSFATSAVGTHEADTTNVHGITNTALLETTSGAQTKVDTHVNDASDAHDASAISIVDAGGYYTGTEVEAALQEAAVAAAAGATFAKLLAGVYVTFAALDRWKSGPGRRGSGLSGTYAVPGSSPTGFTVDDAQTLVSPVKMLLALSDEIVFATAGWTTTSLTIDNTLRSATPGASLLGSTAVAHVDNERIRTRQTRHVALIGDSIAQGTINNTDPYMNRAMRSVARRMGGLVAEEWPMWRSDLSAGSASEWTLGASTITPLALTNTSSLCPYGSIQFTGGTGNLAIWTRPPWLEVQCLDIRWIDQGTTSSEWSYSLDGGTTWVNNPVASSSPSPPRLMVTRIRCNNPTDFRIRAANAAGTSKSFCLPYSPLVTWSSFPTFGVTGGVAFHNLGWDGQRIRAALNARTFTDGVSNGTTTFTSATATFVANDVNSTIFVVNPSTGALIKTTVVARASGTSITLGTTVPSGTGVTFTVFQNAGNGDALRLFDGDPGSIVPDLLILGPWSNDMDAAGGSGDGQPQAMASMLQYIIDRCSPYADIVLTGCYEQGTGVSTSLQSQYRAAIKAVGAANPAVYFDLYEAFAAWGITGYTAANSAGIMADTAHLTAKGNRFVGAEFDRLLGVF